MRKALWLVLAIIGLLWTMLCWFLATLLASGGQAVTTITRWLGGDVASTQWLADILATVGGTAEIFVWIAWAIGTGALLVVGYLGARLSTEATRAAERIAQAQRGYSDPDLMRKGQIFEGEIQSRDISEPPSDR